MDYIHLGKSGLKVSRLSLGAMGFGDPSWRSWVLPEERAKPIIKRALDHGINLIDTSNVYSNGESEALVGRLIGTFVSRSDLVVSTKFGGLMGGEGSPNQRGFSRKSVMTAVEGSLKRLGVDYIDLYQTHLWDSTANLDELMDVLGDLVRSGKVLYLGATDMPTWQFVQAVERARSRNAPGFISMQNHYNLVWRDAEPELLSYCYREGIGVLSYSPMARGFLSGLNRRAGTGQTDRARTDEYTGQWYNRPADEVVARAVASVAQARGVSSSQIALSWVLSQAPVHSTLFGATTPEHVDEAVAAMKLQLTTDEIEQLEEPYLPGMRIP